MNPNAPANQSERPRFPDLAADIGEDPARFLHTDGEGSGKKALVLARISGIDRLAVLNAWLAIERRLTGGRSAVVNALERRRSELEELGERSERCEPGERVDRDTEFVILGPDGEPTERGASATAKVRRLAADGGEVADGE